MGWIHGLFFRVRTIEITVHDVLAVCIVPSVGLQASVADAVAVMRDEQAACVLVTEDDQLRGIFTERDFLIRVATPGLSLTETPVTDVMTANPETLERHDSVAHGIHLMAEHGYRNVPIVDKAGIPVALLGVPEVVDHLDAIFAGHEDESDIYPEDDDWIDIGGG